MFKIDEAITGTTQANLQTVEWYLQVVTLDAEFNSGGIDGHTAWSLTLGQLCMKTHTVVMGGSDMLHVCYPFLFWFMRQNSGYPLWFHAAMQILSNCIRATHQAGCQQFV